MNPANPNANHNTRKVYEYLCNLKNRPDKKVLASQHIGYRIAGMDWQWPRSIGALYDLSNHYPAMVGADYGRATAEEITRGNSDLIDHWNYGGLVTISYHADNPWTGGESSDLTSRDLVELVTPGMEVNSVWIAELDKIAAGLSELQDAGVTVLWRPFHEMNFPQHYGFWWSYGAVTYDHPDQGIGAWVDMWRHMFDYFTYEKSLNNLLWVYGPANRDQWDSVLVCYPGERYVDVVGVSVHNDSTLIMGDGYQKLVSTGKPVALTECGPDPTRDGTWSNLTVINAIRDRYPDAVYSLWWHSWGLPDDPVAIAIVDNQDAVELMTHPLIVTRAEVNWEDEIMPDISTDLRNEIDNLEAIRDDLNQALAQVQILEDRLTQSILNCVAIAERLEKVESDLKASAGEL